MGNNLFASGSTDRTIRVWNAKSVKYKKIIQTNFSIKTICKLNNNLLACGGWGEYQIDVWKINECICLTSLFGHNFVISSLCEINNETIASSSWDGTVRIWNYYENKCLISLKAHNGYVNSICKIDYDRLVSAGNDKTVKIWNLINLECIMSIQLESSIEDVILLKSNIISFTCGSKILVWNIELNKCLRILKNHDNIILSINKIDRFYIASASADNTIKLWNYETGECIESLDGHFSYVVSVCSNFNDFS